MWKKRRKKEINEEALGTNDWVVRNMFWFSSIFLMLWFNKDFNMNISFMKEYDIDIRIVEFNRMLGNVSKSHRFYLLWMLDFWKKWNMYFHIKYRRKKTYQPVRAFFSSVVPIYKKIHSWVNNERLWRGKEARINSNNDNFQLRDVTRMYENAVIISLSYQCKYPWR